MRSAFDQNGQPPELPELPPAIDRVTDDQVRQALRKLRDFYRAGQGEDGSELGRRLATLLEGFGIDGKAQRRLGLEVVREPTADRDAEVWVRGGARLDPASLRTLLGLPADGDQAATRAGFLFGVAVALWAAMAPDVYVDS